MAPDADPRGGAEEPQEGVAEGVDEHREAVDGLCTAHERVAAVLAFQGYLYSSIMSRQACDVFLKSYFWHNILNLQSSNEILYL